jgi:hypothetical protein
MAVQAGFKRFRFFHSEVREGVPSPPDVTCTASGGGSTWLGCADGTVASLGSDLSLQGSFKAHQGKIHGLQWHKVAMLSYAGLQCIHT